MPSGSGTRAAASLPPSLTAGGDAEGLGLEAPAGMGAEPGAAAAASSTERSSAGVAPSARPSASAAAAASGADAAGGSSAEAAERKLSACADHAPCEPLGSHCWKPETARTAHREPLRHRICRMITRVLGF